MYEIRVHDQGKYIIVHSDNSNFPPILKIGDVTVAADCRLSMRHRDNKLSYVYMPVANNSGTLYNNNPYIGLKIIYYVIKALTETKIPFKITVPSNGRMSLTTSKGVPHACYLRYRN